MISKTISDIRNDIVTAYSAHIPSLDISTGTPEREMFIEAPIAGQLINLWNELIYAAKLFAPINYYQDLEESDINTYCANYGIAPVAATYSSGSVIFYTYNKPTTDIYINNGQVVQTLDTPPIQFAVNGSYAMYANSVSNYYNAVLGRYELLCSVVAKLPGAQYRAASGAISNISGNIPGIDGCTNLDLVGGGSSIDTPQSRLQRVVAQFQGRSIASTQGLQNYVNTLTSAANVVGTGSPLMLRDEGLGGCIDIYVRGSTLVTTTDTFTAVITDPTGPRLFTSTGFALSSQPVSSISSFVVNGIALSGASYHLVKDTGILSGSTQGYDRIELTSTGITSTGHLSIGDVINTTYIYNGLLSTIQNTLTNPTNLYINRSYLVRQMTAVTINTTASLAIANGYTWNAVVASVELSIDTYLSSLVNNTSVELANIIGVMKNIAGVSNINIPTVSILNIGGGNLTAQGDILLGANEYAVTGSVNLTQWV